MALLASPCRTSYVVLLPFRVMTRRRPQHPWGISADQLSHALGHGDSSSQSQSQSQSEGQSHGTNSSTSTSMGPTLTGSTARLGDSANNNPCNADNDGRNCNIEGSNNEGEAHRGTCTGSAGEEKRKIQPQEEVKEEISAFAADGQQASFDFVAALPRPSAEAGMGASPSSAERFSYGFDDSASEQDANDSGNSDESENENESKGEHANENDDKDNAVRNMPNNSNLSARQLTQQALDAQQQQQTHEAPVSSPCQPPPTQRETVPPPQAPASDEQVALSLLARERKQLQKRRAQAKADERMAQEVQSELDRLSFAESITSSVGDDEELTKRKEERRRSIEADAEFATLLSSVEDANMQLLRRKRQQQEENDAALAMAEQERGRCRHTAKNFSNSSDAASADCAAAASLSSAQQIQLDELLARTEVARDEIRLEMRNRAVEHDEEVARAEQARERAARDVADEVVAQTLQEEHIRQHWQQGQQYVSPRQQEEVGHVHDDSLPSPPPPLPEQTLPHDRHRVNSSSSVSQLRSPPHASSSTQIGVSSISQLENQLLLSGCTVRDVTDTDEVRRIQDLNIRCAVCMEFFVLGDRVRTLPCLHTFHARCIDQWICLRGKCPIDQNPCL